MMDGAGCVERDGFDVVDGKGPRGTAKDISALYRGTLFMLDGFLGLEGPDFSFGPC